jgi:hypothetical protein
MTEKFNGTEYGSTLEHDEHDEGRARQPGGSEHVLVRAEKGLDHWA